MKKIILMAIALCCLSLGANAKEKIKYQGEVSVGYNLGVGTFKFDRIPIHTVHGVRLNENFFVGVGLGADFFTGNGESLTVVPIFANAKGYYPLSSKFSLLAALDFGYGIGSSQVYEAGGLYVHPQVGCSVNIGRRNAFDFTVGYTRQSISALNFGGVGFKVAFVW